MGRKAFGKLVPFLVVLVVTVGVVAVLSMASRVSPEEAVDRYIRQTESQRVEPEGLSAPAAEGPGISVVSSLTGFLCLMAIPVTGLLVYARSSRKAGRARERRLRNQRTRQDVYLQSPLDTRYRV